MPSRASATWSARGEKITFRALAQTAGVSLDFLYRNAEIRQRVEQLRQQQHRTPPAPPERADPDQRSSVVRTLTAQLAELKRRHREEVGHAAAGARSRPRREPRTPATARPRARRPGTSRGLKPVELLIALTPNAPIS
ncbi:MAG: DUF6262 family protein [Rhodococcus sp. (in: high G+C Gram-positive bacteria)]